MKFMLWQCTKSPVDQYFTMASHSMAQRIKDIAGNDGA